MCSYRYHLLALLFYPNIKLLPFNWSLVHLHLLKESIKLDLNSTACYLFSICRWLSKVKVSLQRRRPGRCGFSLSVGKTTWRDKWQLTLLCLPGESQGQRSLAACNPWGRKKESDTTEQLGVHACILHFISVAVSPSLGKEKILTTFMHLFYFPIAFLVIFLLF